VNKEQQNSDFNVSIIVLCKSHFLKVTTLIEMENEFFVKLDLFVLKHVHKLFIHAIIAIKGSKSLSGLLPGGEQLTPFFVTFNFVRLNFKRPCTLQLSQLINSILF